MPLNMRLCCARAGEIVIEDLPLEIRHGNAGSLDVTPRCRQSPGRVRAPDRTPIDQGTPGGHPACGRMEQGEAAADRIEPGIHLEIHEKMEHPHAAGIGGQGENGHSIYCHPVTSGLLSFWQQHPLGFWLYSLGNA